jgi:predicted membrane protein
MARPTRDLDELIRQALEEGEQEAWEGLGGPSSAELLGEALRGRNRSLALGGVAANLVFFVMGVFAAVNFSRAEEVRVMLLWAGMATLCFGVVLAIKIWYWLEMVRLSMMRDVKRLELQVVYLVRRLNGGDPPEARS